MGEGLKGPKLWQTSHVILERSLKTHVISYCIIKGGSAGSGNNFLNLLLKYQLFNNVGH